nr:unnamed protein product [Digitaria exilis]CAB3503397.1 unnamed protein product [Digitaria exilis]
MGEAAEGSKTLHNWMGEPRPGDQDDEDKALQLSLGLPGGGGGGAGGGGGGAWRTLGRVKGNHSVAGSSMLSLGYSNAAPFSPCSQGKAKGSPAASTGHALASTHNASQTRSPNAPVIGWPPVRTFRRNLATSSRASLDHQKGKMAAKPEEATKRAPFVKINMDAQQDPLAAGTRECPQESVAISGLLDGTGEYTLVYEDYEGDRVLVGDVPWG